MYCFTGDQPGSIGALIPLDGRKLGGGPSEYLFLPAAVGSNNQAILFHYMFCSRVLLY